MSIALDLLYAAGATISSPLWGYQLLRTGKWRTDWAGRMGNAATPQRRDAATKRLLIHSVSVGETNLIRLLVEHLEREAPPPEVEVVISATTNTGIARAMQLYGPPEGHEIVRYPLDFSCAVNRFLDAVQPDAVALVENEVWPNFVEACDRRGVPVCVINGRLTHRSHRRYAMLRPIVRRMYGRLTAVAAQTPEYAQRFVDLGAPADRVHVLDTMKWDTAQVEDAATVAGADQLAVEMGIDCSRPLIVAGSTGPGEERLLIDTCPPDAQLMLVPRKPERFDEVAALDPTIVRRTQRAGPSPAPERSLATDTGAAPGTDGPARPKLFLLDTIGELRKAYALADVCIVGRSFLGLYGSDVMEPVALGKPTIIGPHHADFADAVAALRDAGGLLVATPDTLAPTIATLLTDRAKAAELAHRGVNVILSRQGSTRRHADLLLGVLAGTC